MRLIWEHHSICLFDKDIPQTVKRQETVFGLQLGTSKEVEAKLQNELIMLNKKDIRTICHHLKPLKCSPNC